MCESKHPHAFECFEEKLDLRQGDYKANRSKILAYIDPTNEARPEQWGILDGSGLPEYGSGLCICSHSIHEFHYIKAFGAILTVGRDCIHRFGVPHLTKGVNDIIKARVETERRADPKRVYCSLCPRVLSKNNECMDLQTGLRDYVPDIRGPELLAHLKCAKGKKCRCGGYEGYSCVCRPCSNGLCDAVVYGPAWKTQCHGCYVSRSSRCCVDCDKKISGPKWKKRCYGCYTSQ